MDLVEFFSRLETKSLNQEGSFWLISEKDVSLETIDCDRDIQNLIARMGLDNEQDVLRAVADSHQAM